jgi:hypothetical protein
MADYLQFQTSAELKSIEQSLVAELEAQDILLEMFPTTVHNAAKVMWEQEDNYTGMTNVRGLNGQPGRVRRTGSKRYEMEPGYYADETEIDEYEIALRRDMGSLGEPINLETIVSRRQLHLLVREVDRKRYMVAQLLCYGLFTSTDKFGNVIHTDAYPLRQYSVGTPWSNKATSTPLADTRAAVTAARVGQSSRFDQTATMLVNSNTMNNLLGNYNPNDLGGKRQEMGATFNTIEEINRLMMAADLPKIVPYDKAYSLDDGATYTRFIPDGIAVIIGARQSGAPVGEIQMVRNAANPNAEPGTHTIVSDSLNSMNPVPRKLLINHGFSGGIAIYYPGSVVTMSV